MSNSLKTTVKFGVYGLDEEERAELAKELQNNVLNIEVRPFEQRSAEKMEAVRFVIQDIILPGITVNALWDAFKFMLIKAWKFAHKKKPEANISGWVISIQNNYSLNLMLPNKEVDLDTMLSLLPDFLQKLETERTTLQDKIISVIFDNDTKKLKVQKI